MRAASRFRILPIAVLIAASAFTISQRIHVAEARVVPKPRVVVTADPELDDSNSLVRYLLYSTDFQTEGLIYASSGFHWKGDGTGKKWAVPNREYSRFGLNLCPCESWRWAPNERFIDDAVEIYERVYPNLRVHNPDYPSPSQLRSKIRWGNVEFDGDISKDTPGSDLIKSLLLDNKPGPIYLLAWGGQSTIARALKSIQDTYKDSSKWEVMYRRVVTKAVLSASGDQDDTYKTYIQPNWPDIKSLPIGMGGVPLAYGAAARAGAANAVFYSPEWTRENVSSKGALGSFYRVWGDGKQMVKDDIFDYFGLAGFTAEQLRAKGFIVWTPPLPKGAFIGEGDTFTYLNLLDNGLLGYKEGTAGGWAGNGSSNPTRQVAGSASSAPAQSPNFMPAAQNDFAARMTWSVTPKRGDANHEPRVAIRGNSRISARPGETIALRGVATDPDGNTITVKWWQCKEAGTYPAQVVLSSPNSLDTRMQVPSDAVPGQTLHVVLEVTDNGKPSLTRYQRLVISVTH